MAKKTTRSQHKTQRKKNEAAAEATPIGVAFVRCLVVRFELSSKNLAEVRRTGYSVAVHTIIDPKQQTTTLTTTVDISWEGNKESESGVLASITTTSMYKISGLDGMQEITEFPGWIAATMTSASIGTTRGLLLSKLANTPYADLILPLFDLNSFLPEEATKNVASHGI